MPVASHPKYVGVSFLESIMYKDLYRIKDLFWWLIDLKFENFQGTIFNHNEQKGNLHLLPLCLYPVRAKIFFKKKKQENFSSPPVCITEISIFDHRDHIAKAYIH